VNSNEQFLCMVKDGKLTILLPESEAGNVVRLTEMPMQAAIPPEAQEISVKKHEGKAIMVEGRIGGGWIYSTEMIDLAGLILSASSRLQSSPSLMPVLKNSVRKALSLLCRMELMSMAAWSMDMSCRDSEPLSLYRRRYRRLNGMIGFDPSRSTSTINALKGR
jgi:hypothetical protein